MAGGQKHWRTRSIKGTANVDGVALLWELAGEPSWSNSGDGHKGMCIAVRVADIARRELVVEYPFPVGKDGRPLPVPQRPPLSQAMVEASIRDAIQAGWDPASRGKAFVFYPSVISN